jgi:hypothetical protein
MRGNTSMVEDVQAIYSVVQIDSSSEKWLKLSKYFDQTVLIKNSVNLDYGSSCHVLSEACVSLFHSCETHLAALEQRSSVRKCQ